MSRLGPSPNQEQTSQLMRISIGGEEYQIHYNDTGGDGPVVVMLHGSGPGATGWSNFYRNVDAFSSAGYRVILMDCLGWGKSDPIISTGSRSDLNAETLKQLLDGLRIDSAHLIGNSMGAHSVVAFALSNPLRAKKLILMGGGTGGLSMFSPMPTEGIKCLNAVYREPTISNIKRMMEIFVFDPKNLTEELISSRLSNMLGNELHLHNFISSLAANPKQFPDQSSRLNDITAPTLIIWGRDDRFVPLDLGLRLISGIPDSEMHIFSHCGHWAQWEHSERFNALALSFLAQS